MPVARVVDLSVWQPHYSAAAFKSAADGGVWGIINKASQGSNRVDTTYEERRPLAKAAGQEWAGYHFLDASNTKLQLELFLRVLRPDDRTAGVLDWETNQGYTPPADQAHEFCQRYYEKVGRRPIIYSGNVAKEKLGTKVDPFFAVHRLWLAMYASRPVCQASWRTSWAWQFSGDGLGPLPHFVAGLGSNIDLSDYVPGDNVIDLEAARAAFRREWASDASDQDLKPNAPQSAIPSQNVKLMQQNLALLGFNLGTFGADGVMGGDTINAIRAFQTTAHIKVDGVFGPITSAALDLALAQRSATLTKRAA